MNKNKKAFTLVELIVVITILAILGTIAFISMQSYSASSRDSVRISDMSKMSSSLELFNIDSGKYPDPTEAQPITYSGGLAWYQGIFGNATFINVARLDEIPKDPLTEKEYAYSVLNTKQEFEIGGILEGNDVVFNSINQTNAIEKIVYGKITGTYNGVALRVNANNTSYILAVPSILTSIDLGVETNRTLELIVPSNELVLDNYNNLPSNYVGTSYDSNKETTNTDFKIVNNILVYEGDVKNLTPTLLITKLQESYSGTTVALLDATAELFQINVESLLELEKIDNYGINFINNNLGGTAVSRIYNTCGGVAHNTMKSYYSSPSVLFRVSCDTVKKDFICIDGTWVDIPTGANILDYPETGCFVEDALNCTYLGTPINHEDSITVYSQDTILWNATSECTNEGIEGEVTCNNGVNEGDTTFAYKTCTKGTPTNCTADSNYDLNGHIYNVIQMNHDVSSTATVDVSENNGIFRYTFNAICNDGTITGNETGPVNVSCNTNYTWNGSNACTDQTGPVISSISSSSSSCETIRYTITATDSIGLNASAYSFDGGSTWQSGNTKDYSSTSLTKSSTDFKVKDSAGNITTYTSDVSGTSSSCYTYSWDYSGRGSCSSSSYWGSRGSCSVTCGGGTKYSYCQQPSGSKTRTVYCKRSDGTQVSDGYCTGTKPTSSVSCTADLSGCSGLSSQSTSCNTQSCYSYSWYSSSRGSCSATSYRGSRGSCSVTCGGGTKYSYCQQPSGTKTRSVYCKRNDGVQVSDGNCTGTRPSSSLACTADLNGCSGAYAQSTSCNTQSCCASNMGASCSYNEPVAVVRLPSSNCSVPRAYCNTPGQSVKTCSYDGLYDRVVCLNSTGKVQCDGSCK